MTSNLAPSTGWSSIAATVAEEAMLSDDADGLLKRLLRGVMGLHGLHGALLARLSSDGRLEPDVQVGTPDATTGDEAARWKNVRSAYPDDLSPGLVAFTSGELGSVTRVLLLAGMSAHPRPALAADAREALRLCGVIATAISQREEARQRRNRLENIVDATEAGTWEWEVTTGRCWMNLRWADICGRTLEELGPLSIDTWTSIVHPEDLPECIRKLDEHIAGKSERYDDVYRLRHADGRWRWVHDRGRVVQFTVDGRPRLMVGSHSDISQLKDYEAALETRNATLRAHAALLDTAGRLARIGGWRYEAGSNGPAWTDAVCAIHGVESGFRPSLAEALDFYSATSRPLLAAAVEACIADGTPWDLEVEMHTAKGERRWVHVQGERESTEGGPTCIFGAVQDITDRRAMQQALMASNASLEARVLERTESLEAARRHAEDARRAKDEFLTNISHELRSPLHSVLGFTQLALDDLGTADPATLRRFIERSRSSASELLTLVNDLLDAAKIESGRLTIEPKACRLDVLLNDVIAEFEVAYGNKSLVIERHVECQTMVNADGTRMAQALRNVMANAIRFSPHGGRIEMSIGHGATKTIELMVADEGPGIPEGELETVFDRFTQSSHTKTGAGGTGLGLPIARGILELHGGRLWAERRPQGGTAFRFELPTA